MKHSYRIWRTAIGLCGALAVCAIAEPATPTIAVTPHGSLAAGAFERSEWRVDLGQTYDNPFDPKLIAVDATFVDPRGKAHTIPAFWNVTNDAPKGAFFVRFAPPTAGKWSFTVAATDAEGRRASASQSFDLAASDRTGIVRVADNHRYLRFDNGTSYFPIGLNLAWPPGKERAAWYETMFTKLADARGNFARVWMADPRVMLESDRTGPHRYDLQNADYYDQVLDSAQKHGIGVMLCFMNHRELLGHDMWGKGGWDASVFNAKNGGPATQPADFFSNPAAAEQFQARLRYIVARYASFTSVAFWELFNEQEGTLMNIPVAWDTDMAAYLHRVDPYQHLVTTSSIVPDGVWQSSEIAITQSHPYGNGTTIDMVAPIPSAQATRDKFDKPHLFAEFGIDYHGGDFTFDPSGKGTAFHNALWSAALSGSAGSAMYWWWDNYIDPKNQWHEFKSLADFTSDIDWAHAYFKPLHIIELRRATSDGPFTDLNLPSGGGWGVVAREPIVVPANGRLNQPMPRFLCSPVHKDEYQPITFSIDLTQPSHLLLDINRVSDFAMLRVSVDGTLTTDVPFSALPGTPGTSGNAFEKDVGFFRADVKHPTTVPTTLPAGKHTIKVDNLAGDWVTLDGMTFTNALDPRYANLTAIAIQDTDSHQTLAWILDTRSNWKFDQTQEPQPQAGVQVVIPNIDHGNFTAEWWDTRRGTIVQSDHVSVIDGKLTLNVPTFTRDIALKLRP